MGWADRHWRELSFDELPALRLRRRSLRSAMRTATMAWMFGIFWAACVSGSQMTNFCRFLGFDAALFGLLSAIAYAASLWQLYAAAFVERTGVRKYHFIYTASAHRLLWVAIAVMGWLMKPGPAAIAVFLTLFGISSVLANISTPGWQIWMGDMIPRRIRARYFANRSLRTVPIQVTVSLLTGYLLDRIAIPGAAVQPGEQPMLLLAICIIFAVGGLAGIADILMFLRLREIATVPLSGHHEAPRWRSLKVMFNSAVEPLQMLRRAFDDRTFRHYALYGATIAFSITVSNQFFWLNAMEDIGFSRLGANGLFLVIGPVAALLMIRPFGAMIDRWGRKPILALGTLGATISPVFWFLMIPGHTTTNYVLGAISCFFGEACWSAVGLGQTSVMLGFSDSTGRSRYMAGAAVVTAIGGFVGGLTGGTIVGCLEGLHAHPLMIAGAIPWTNYHVCFLVTMLARGLSVLWLRGMPEPGARPAGYVFRTIRVNVYSNVMFLLSWPLRIFRRP